MKEYINNNKIPYMTKFVMVEHMDKNRVHTKSLKEFIVDENEKSKMKPIDDLFGKDKCVTDSEFVVYSYDWTDPDGERKNWENIHSMALKGCYPVPEEAMNRCQVINDIMKILNEK